MPDSTRQLVVIMFTDIVGYTALMGEDVESGLELLRKNRDIQKPLIEKYNGQFLKEMGDGILAMFHSAADSVLCALEIQKAVSPELSAKIRIGIHLGDVTIENDDVFGDGVNIASRLQSIADPGGIYISESTYEAIRARNDMHCEYLGDVQLKNVDHPIRTYFLIEKGLPVPSTKKRKELTGFENKPINKKPWFWIATSIIVIAITVLSIWISGDKGQNIRSIAVLPVENLSENDDEEWLTAGIHNGLIDEMVKIQKLRIVPRRSTLKYASANLSIPQIADELDVDGIVEVSFSKTGNNLFIQVRLIQAHPEERQLWNTSYDRSIQNILSTYTDVVKMIAQVINISLSADEVSVLSGTRSVNPDAYEAYIKGKFHIDKQDNTSLNTAMEYFEIATEIDPEFALAYYGSAMVWIGKMQGGFLPYNTGKPKFEDAMKKAFLLDSTIIEAHFYKTIFNYYYSWAWDAAEKGFLSTLKMSPNNREALAHYAHYLATMGQVDKAIQYGEKAFNLAKSNLTNHGYYAMSLRHAHQYDEAINILEEALKRFPEGEMMIFSTLRSAYHDKQMYDEAINAGKRYYEIKEDTVSLVALEQGYREGGYQLALQRNAEALIEQSKAKYITPWQVSTLYTRAGMKEEALDWLGKAYEVHDPNMPSISCDPIFDYLREEPRFIEILRKMKLPIRE
ncbi:adenylate/guanylate cyclase domain-containing protein [Bacteroidota bacterium]